jgi:hypothetical protein
VNVFNVEPFPSAAPEVTEVAAGAPMVPSVVPSVVDTGHILLLPVHVRHILIAVSISKKEQCPFLAKTSKQRIRP